MTVTSDLSPAEPAVQRFDKENIRKLSAKNASRRADWQRCASEFACGSSWKTSSLTGKCLRPWMKTLVCRGASAQSQPKAKKRLASRLADEILPAQLGGKCCI